MNYSKPSFLILIFSLITPFVILCVQNQSSRLLIARPRPTLPSSITPHPQTNPVLVSAIANATAKAVLTERTNHKSHFKLFLISSLCIIGIIWGFYQKPWASNKDMQKLTQEASQAVTQQLQEVQDEARRQFNTANNQHSDMAKSIQGLKTKRSFLEKTIEDHFKQRRSRRTTQETCDRKTFEQQQQLLHDGHQELEETSVRISQKNNALWLETQHQTDILAAQCNKSAIIQELQARFMETTVDHTTQTQQTALACIKNITPQIVDLRTTIRDLTQGTHAVQEELSSFRQIITTPT